MSSGDIERMRRKAKALERRVEEAKEALGAREFMGEAGGGAVRARVSGDQRLLGLEISPEAIDPPPHAALAAWIIEAVNAALERSKRAARLAITRAAGGMKIPGL